MEYSSSDELLWNAIDALDERAASDALRDGANPNCYFHGMTALTRAAFRGSAPMVQQLLKAGADIDSATGADAATTLMHLVSTGYNYQHGQIIKLLLERGANINARNYKNETALDLAAQYGQMTYANLLLKHGAACKPSTQSELGRLGLSGAWLR